jgi:hypothetical protein
MGNKTSPSNTISAKHAFKLQVNQGQAASTIALSTSRGLWLRWGFSVQQYVMVLSAFFLFFD